MNSLNHWAPRVLSLLRIVAALLFIEHGAMKFFHFPIPQPGAPSPLPAMLLAAAWLEMAGGLLVLLGLFTRPAAFLLSGEMAVAYFTAHFPHSPWPGVNQGEARLFSVGFFFFCFRAPGVCVGRRRCEGA